MAAIAPAISSSREVSATNYRKRVEQLTELMTPINANKGSNNCGHVALRLNSYLADLDGLALKKQQGISFNIPPIPTSNADQLFHFHYPSKTRIESMTTNNSALVTRCTFDKVKISELIDLTQDVGRNAIQMEIIEETENKSLTLKHATTDTIVAELRALRRRASDNTAFGFLVLARPISFQLHIINFFVDKDNQVYFLDAQPDPVYVKDVLLSGYIKDIFYASSVPAPILTNNPSTASIGRQDSPINTKIKQEDMMFEPPSLEKIREDIKPSSESSILSATEKVAKDWFDLALTTTEIKQRVEYVQKSAALGYAKAQAELGSCYAKGLGVPKDPVKAFQNYDLSAKQNHALGQFGLGECYRLGIGVAVDPVKAFQNYDLSAKQNHAGGYCGLGKCYRHGIGVAVDPVKAFQNYDLLAKQNHALGQFGLGECYRFGIGVAVDPVKAFQNYELSAKQKHAGGYCGLGKCYRHGIGVSVDPVKAFENYDLSAKQNLAEGQYGLGECYRFGIGVAVDPVKAFQNYDLSAKQNHAGGYCGLGKCYRYGIGVAVDPVKAFENDDLLAKQNHALGQYRLGECYRFGRGVAVDPVKAFQNYDLSAKQNHAWGYCGLGDCYRFGIGVAVDPVKAFENYDLSAKQNNAPGQCGLGECYQYGIGVPINLIKAKHFYGLSASQGFAIAQAELQKLEQNPQPQKLIATNQKSAQELEMHETLKKQSEQIKELMSKISNLENTVTTLNKEVNSLRGAAAPAVIAIAPAPIPSVPSASASNGTRKRTNTSAFVNSDDHLISGEAEDSLQRLKTRDPKRARH